MIASAAPRRAAAGVALEARPVAHQGHVLALGAGVAFVAFGAGFLDAFPAGVAAAGDGAAVAGAGHHLFSAAQGREGLGGAVGAGGHVGLDTGGGGRGGRLEGGDGAAGLAAGQDPQVGKVVAHIAGGGDARHGVQRFLRDLGRVRRQVALLHAAAHGVG